MPSRMLLLCRLFLRLDNVIFRIRDTRVYVDFLLGILIREYTEKEAPYVEVVSVISIFPNNTYILEAPDKSKRFGSVFEGSELGSRVFTEG